MENERVKRDKKIEPIRVIAASDHRRPIPLAVKILHAVTFPFFLPQILAYFHQFTYYSILKNYIFQNIFNVIYKCDKYLYKNQSSSR